MYIILTHYIVNILYAGSNAFCIFVQDFYNGN